MEDRQNKEGGREERRKSLVKKNTKKQEGKEKID
jgi:hypothetical protein